MLEILLMRSFLKSIGNMLRAKGRSAGGFQFLAAILWIGLEITGVVVGMSNGMGNGAFLLGLMGAATGAGIGYGIAAAAKPAVSAHEVGKVFD